jgi:hypothetical protein
MNCCRETVKMGVPARHREPARSGPHGIARLQPRRADHWVDDCGIGIENFHKNS